MIASTHALLFAASTLGFGCAVDPRELGSAPPAATSVGFELVTGDGVELDTVRYDVNTPGGEDVLDGTLDVRSKSAELTFGVDELPPGDYDLALVAVGMHGGAPSLCTSDPIPFAVTPGEALRLPPVTFTCRVQDPTNQTWSVSPGVAIAIETLEVGGEGLAFTYSPAAAKGHLDANGSCNYQPIVVELTSFENDLEVTLDESPDGALAGGNPSLPQLTYACASDGDKTLSLAATRGTDTLTKAFVVHCDGSSCAAGGPVCGNSRTEAGEACDENTPRCVNCEIHPTCGDGVVDAPEACDARALPTPSCDVNCRSVNAP
ncbi:MAG TPA: hypothetical protein VMI54_14765 [Polyangiaceae bacterium]|nr:hypothetical protein [Polyangiaceae bacterium]